MVASERIVFRLTPDEKARGVALMTALALRDWSKLVRHCIRTVLAQEESLRPITPVMSDEPLPLFEKEKKKGTARKKPAAKKKVKAKKDRESLDSTDIIGRCHHATPTMPAMQIPVFCLTHKRPVFSDSFDGRTRRTYRPDVVLRSRPVDQAFYSAMEFKSMSLLFCPACGVNDLVECHDARFSVCASCLTRFKIRVVTKAEAGPDDDDNLSPLFRKLQESFRKTDVILPRIASNVANPKGGA